MFGVTAFQTDELFCLAVLGLGVAALATLPRRARRADRHDLTAEQRRLVFQHAPGRPKGRVLEGAIKSRLLADVRSRIFDRSTRRSGHIGDVKVLDEDQAVVFGHDRRNLVLGIVAPPLRAPLAIIQEYIENQRRA